MDSINMTPTQFMFAKQFFNGGNGDDWDDGETFPSFMGGEDKYDLTWTNGKLSVSRHGQLFKDSDDEGDFDFRPKINFSKCHNMYDKAKATALDEYSDEDIEIKRKEKPTEKIEEAVEDNKLKKITWDDYINEDENDDLFNHEDFKEEPIKKEETVREEYMTINEDKELEIAKKIFIKKQEIKELERQLKKEKLKEKKFKAGKGEKIKCDCCHISFRRDGLARHLKSKTHQRNQNVMTATSSEDNNSEGSLTITE